MEWEAELDRDLLGEPGAPGRNRSGRRPLPLLIPKTAFRGAHRRLSDGPGEDEVRDSEELIVYCDLVATTIRDITLAIFGARGETAFRLGRSFLDGPFSSRISSATGGEDLDRGRIYLPREERASGSA